MNRLAQITQISGYPGYFNVNNYQTFPAQLVSRVLLFAIAGAGLYFFYQLVTSGFSYMGAFGDEARLQQIMKQITNALIGLLVVISSYFIIQIVQYITGTNIL